MTADQTPEQRAESFRRKVITLEEKVADLSGECHFADELEAVSQREAKLEELEAKISELRQIGYEWGGGLEDALAGVMASAPGCLSDARAETAAAADRLRPMLGDASRNVQRLAGEANLADDKHRVESLERQVEGLENALGEARDRITAISKHFTEPFDTLERSLKKAKTTMDRFEERSFDLLPEEDPLAAVEATWQNSPEGDEMSGMLMFTQHRLRFEQREEVVTKRKFLFFTAEKELIKKCWIDEPIGRLAASDDSTKGLVFKDQLLTLTWDGNCRWQPKTVFEIEEGKAKEIDRLVEAVASGEIESDRRICTDEASASTHLEWPEDCPDCGARIDPPVKGQTRLTCEFCGRKVLVREVKDG